MNMDIESNLELDLESVLETNINPESESESVGFASASLVSILEALLFASDRVLSLSDLQKLFPIDQAPTKAAIQAGVTQLMRFYADPIQSRGIELAQVATGYRFQVKAKWSDWVARLWEEKPARYSRATLEVLAIIAYRQPITRAEIEAIRGVSVSSTMIKTLEEERGWIKVVGQREVPGRPCLYATTKTFLDYFNLLSLKDLPELDLESHADSKTQSVAQSELLQLSGESNHVPEEATESTEFEKSQEQQESQTEDSQDNFPEHFEFEDDRKEDLDEFEAFGDSTDSEASETDQTSESLEDGETTGHEI